MLGQSAPYARADLPSGVAADLGMQVSLEPAAVMNLVATWAKAGEEGHAADADTMGRLFCWLAARATSDGTQRDVPLRWLEEMRRCRCVWVPRQGSAVYGQPAPQRVGDFFYADECAWRDETGLLDCGAAASDAVRTY